MSTLQGLKTSFRKVRHSNKGRTKFRLFRSQGAWLGVTIFLLGSLSFGAWAASSSIGSTPDAHYHLPSIVCGSFAGPTCETAPGTGGEKREKLLVPEALIEGLSCTTQRPFQSAGCQPLMDGSDQRTREHSDINVLKGLYPVGFYETLHFFSQPSLELTFVSARWFNGILFIALTMTLWWASPLRVRNAIQWMWPLAIVPMGMFFIASANPTSWAIVGVGTAWIALLGFLDTRGPRSWLLAGIYVFSVILASSARIDATLFVLATSLIAFWLSDVSIKERLKRAWPFFLGIAIVTIRLLLRPGNLGTVSEGFGQRNLKKQQYQEPLTWSSLKQEPTFDASAVPTFDWNLLWRNFWEVPGLWFGVFGGYPWGSLGWLDTTMPQIVPIVVLTCLMAVAMAALRGASPRQIVGVLGMLGVIWFIPLYLLQIGGFKVGEEFQSRYLIPMVVVMVGMLVIRSSSAPPVLTERFPLAAIAIGLGVANSIALHTNIRRYVTGLDIGGIDLNYAREWWWWFMPQFFTPNWLWVGGSLAFFGLTWILVYHLPRRALAAAEVVSAR